MVWALAITDATVGKSDLAPILTHRAAIAAALGEVFARRKTGRTAQISI